MKAPTLPAALWGYRLATALAEPFAALALDRRVKQGKEDAARLPERLAQRLDRHAPPRPDGPLVWLHGASVGESLSLLPVVERLRARRPELGVLVTSGTVTSAALLAQRLPEGVIHQYAPVDAPDVAARFLTHWRPDLAVFVESELWPNLLVAARKRGGRTALISARLSAASLQRWGKAPASARALIGGFDLVMAQDDATARALTDLGARDDGRLNLKLAADPLPVDEAALVVARAAAAGRPVLVAASTHAGEDELALDAFARLEGAPLLVIAPRHPERGAAVADLARARGLAVTRHGAGEAFGAAPVHVADALGELGLWFRLADAVLVGGSLVKGPGGHNPLEPARLGAPVVSGLHVDNWREVYQRLGQAVAYVGDAPMLAAIWGAMLANPAAAQARAALGRERADAEAGGADLAVDRLLALADR